MKCKLFHNVNTAASRFFFFHINSNVFIADENWGHFLLHYGTVDRKIDTTVYIQLYNICNNRVRNTSKLQTAAQDLEACPPSSAVFFKSIVFLHIFFKYRLYTSLICTRNRGGSAVNSEKVVKITFPGGHRSLLKRWSLVGFLLVQKYVAWTCYRVEKLRQRQLREDSGLHWFLLCVICAKKVDVVLLEMLTDTRQTRTWKVGTGEAPFKAGLSNLSNPILSHNPPKTSIAYIRVISTHFVQHIWSHKTNQNSISIAFLPILHR